MNRFDRPRQVLAVCLTGLAGFVDASGFMANGGYFISFMSGNTTRLAVDLAHAPPRALVPAGLITGFVAGVMLGSVTAHLTGPRRKPWVLALVTCLLLAGAELGRFGFAIPAQAAMVMAMGALNATFQRDGEVAIGLTYMTGALVQAGQGLAALITGRAVAPWGAQAVLWAGLLTGGVAGAVTYMHLGPDTQWLAAGWAAIMGVVAARLIEPVA